MTSLASPLPDVQSDNRHLLPVKLALTLGLAACADWLFYEPAHRPLLVLFAVALFALLARQSRRLRAAASRDRGRRPPRRTRPRRRGAQHLVVPSSLSRPSSSALLSSPIRTFRGSPIGLRAFLDLFLFGPFRLIGDAIRMTNVRAFTSGFALWFVPLLFSAIFVALFASANPLIERWIRELNPRDADLPDQPRAYAVLGFRAIDGLAVHPCALAAPEGTHRRRAAACRRHDRDRIGLLQPLRRGDDPALADPVQPAVRGADRARPRLSLGQRQRFRPTSATPPMPIAAPIP